MKGGGNPGGGCQDGLVRWDELLSEGDGNKNSSLFYRDPVAFEKKCCFLVLWEWKSTAIGLSALTRALL